jgi:hypothetical protein
MSILSTTRFTARRTVTACTRALRSQVHWLLLAAAAMTPQSAAALPSFSMQTNQPCSSCHIDAYGPRLNQAGRDFKLHAFTASDGQSHPLPVSVFAQFSFTRNSSTNQNAIRAGFPGNDYFSVDQANGYYAGKVMDNLGAVASVSYQPDFSALRWGTLDVRYAREFPVFGTPLVTGAVVNNAPGEADLWGDNPLSVSPFVQSKLSKIAQGEPLANMIAGSALGVGGYALWNDTLYIEGDDYSALGRNSLNVFGAGAVLGTDQLRHTAPYWRIALQHEFSGGEHHVEFGTYGLSADAYPYSLETAGSNHFEDKALDFTYEWTPHSGFAASDTFSVHGLYLHEDADFPASQRLFGGPSFDKLTRLQVDASYTIDSTVTPGLQYFATTGTGNRARWWASPSGRPDSNGVIAELQFAPFGSPDSPSHWYNARVAVQYVAYTKYNGVSAGASSNNAVCLTLSFAVSPEGLL